MVERKDLTNANIAAASDAAGDRRDCFSRSWKRGEFRVFTFLYRDRAVAPAGDNAAVRPLFSAVWKQRDQRIIVARAADHSNIKTTARCEF